MAFMLEKAIKANIQFWLHKCVDKSKFRPDTQVQKSSLKKDLITLANQSWPLLLVKAKGLYFYSHQQGTEQGEAKLCIFNLNSDLRHIKYEK